jgi:hypothetical protein
MIFNSIALPIDISSDSDRDSQISARKFKTPDINRASNKARIIQQKLQESNAGDQNSTINAIAQTFQPSQKSLANQVCIEFI